MSKAIWSVIIVVTDNNNRAETNIQYTLIRIFIIWMLIELIKLFGYMHMYIVDWYFWTDSDAFCY